MNKIITHISLELWRMGCQVSISAKAGDTSRKLHINLTSNSIAYNISLGTYATLSIRRANSSFYSVPCTISGNIVTVEFDEAMVECEGENTCELNLFDSNGNAISSPSFSMYIYSSVRDEYASRATATDDFRELNIAVANARSATNNANSAAESAREIANRADQLAQSAYELAQGALQDAQSANASAIAAESAADKAEVYAEASYHEATNANNSASHASELLGDADLALSEIIKLQEQLIGGDDA